MKYQILWSIVLLAIILAFIIGFKVMLLWTCVIIPLGLTAIGGLFK